MTRIQRDRIIRPFAVLLLAGVFLFVPLGSNRCRCQIPPSLMDHSYAAGGDVPETAVGDSSCVAKLKEFGLTLRLNYTGEAFHGFGVIPEGVTEYRGLVELEVSLDTGRAGLWPQGELFVKGQNGHGEGFIVNPGGVPLFLSDIGAPDFTQVSEYGLKQQFMDGDVRVNFGKQNANDYFSVNRVGGSFILPAYTLIPTVPMPTFPAYSIGTSLFVEPREWLSLGVGAGGPELRDEIYRCRLHVQRAFS
jgi:carbohydrate-selective porin OprB